MEYTITTQIDNITVFKGNKEELLNYVSSNFREVGKRTPLYSIAYVLLPKYNLYRGNKRIYSI